MTRRPLLYLGLAVALATGAPAALAARPAALDARVQLVDYDPDRITSVRAALGFQLMIEFAPDERIENVSIGDAMGWQVTPNRRANVLFLKPTDGQATNMTVVTDRRRYLFDLRLAGKAARTAYTVRFVYPAPVVAQVLRRPESEPQIVNAAYALGGSSEIRPTRVFDDGEMTYFEWPAQSPLPAIYAVSGKNAESLVNYTVRGRYVVVQQLSPRFTLRYGKAVASVVNDSAAVQQAQRSP